MRIYATQRRVSLAVKRRGIAIVTQAERAKLILNHIMSLPHEAWSRECLGDVDVIALFQKGWTALLTPKFIQWPPSEDELNAAGEAEKENDFPFSFDLDLLVAARGKVRSLDCGYEDRLVSMRPGPWERELFGAVLDAGVSEDANTRRPDVARLVRTLAADGRV